MRAAWLFLQIIDDFNVVSISHFYIPVAATLY